jgi:sulfite reductase (NADPH) hemoprotein beta-component
MSAVEDPRTLGRTALSFASAADVDEFAHALSRFESGEMSPDGWRAFRLVRGTYGQRQDGDAQMLRVKIPQGRLTASQLAAVADTAERFSRGFGHITTRQNIQLHFLALADVEPAMRRLAAAGLTTREACGNAVRNITACPYAGVAADEAFDVTPYAEALTRHFLRHPLGSSLPRKFKIAFEGCARDHALTAINDLGWRARVDASTGGRRRGFSVTAGGGTATRATAGGLLYDFLPAGQMLEVAEAVLRVFDRLGDRTDRSRNRMKFLIAKLGFEEFAQAVESERAAIHLAGGIRLPFDPDSPEVEGPPDWLRQTPPSPAEALARAASAVLRGPGIHPIHRVTTPVDTYRWHRTNVRPQRQAGFSLVTVHLPLGDFTSAQMRLLGELAESYGDGTVRITPQQDVVFRWIEARRVSALHERLAAAGLGHWGAGTAADVTSCPGAESCRLAVTQSRGLGRLLGDFLSEREDLVTAVPDLELKISGCPNGCGQHHIAGIGFQGSIKNVGGRVVPQYFVMLGGSLEGGSVSFARLAARIPARRVPLALEILIGLYIAERHEGETATEFFRRVEIQRAKAALADLERISMETLDPVDFVDLGEEEVFQSRNTMIRPLATG